MTDKGQAVGYVRVSSIDQKTDRQLMNVELDEVFTDKASGKDRNRPELKRCLKHVRKGDTLHVHSIDRLARNLVDLQQIVEELNGRGVSVKFEKESLTFTADDNSPMATLMLQMMGSFAQFERSMIRERQREGIAAAKAKGKKFGRPPKLTDTQRAEIKRQWGDGVSPTETAKEFNVSRAAVYKICSKIERGERP